MEANILKCARSLDDLKKTNDSSKKTLEVKHTAKHKEDTLISIPQDIEPSFVKKDKEEIQEV